MIDVILNEKSPRQTTVERYFKSKYQKSIGICNAAQTQNSFIYRTIHYIFCIKDNDETCK